MFRSANANVDDLLLFIENDKNRRMFDIIILFETWHDVNFCNLLIHNYNTYYTKFKRNQNDRIIVFSKNDICIDHFELIYDQANIVKLNVKLSNNLIILYCIYRSPASDVQNCLTILNDTLLKEKSTKGFVALMGVININIIGNKSTNNDHLDMLSHHGFKSFINVYTRNYTFYTSQTASLKH